MSIVQRFYTFSNGVKIPSMGFGTAGTDAETTIHAICSAVEAGYRHIDTATIYGNEKSVGDGIRSCGLDRKDLFLTSKLWNDDQGYKNTYRAFEKSLELLQTDYLDLYLIHWPIPKKYKERWQEVNLESWTAMEELYEKGRIRAIGVSNFQPKHLLPLMQKARIQPMADQLELHPGCHQEAAVDFCHSHNMVVEAWSPLMHGGAIGLPELVTLAEKYNKSTAQICLRWSLQRGILPLPKSVTPERIRSNLDVFDFELTQEDMQLVDALRRVGPLGPFPDDAAM